MADGRPGSKRTATSPRAQRRKYIKLAEGREIIEKNQIGLGADLTINARTSAPQTKNEKGRTAGPAQEEETGDRSNRPVVIDLVRRHSAGANKLRRCRRIAGPLRGRAAASPGALPEPAAAEARADRRAIAPGNSRRPQHSRLPEARTRAGGCVMSVRQEQNSDF